MTGRLSSTSTAIPGSSTSSAYRFAGHENLHVRGYKEKGNINTPLELAILNETSRFHLVIDVIERVPRFTNRCAHLKEEMKNAIVENLQYAHEHG